MLQEKKLLKDIKQPKDKKDLAKFVNVLVVVIHLYLYITIQGFVQTVMLVQSR
jgi:hypothetical protein